MERYDNGTRKLAEYVVDGQVVGTRFWDDDGYLSLERPCKNGLLHGVEYTWYFDGVLTSAAPYVDGVPHGVAKQWARCGRLVGSYKMVRGTGIDLFWNALEGIDANPHYLSEVHYMRDGDLHGYTWWLNDDQTSVRVERHYVQGYQHGIDREWNHRGRLRRGFPRYFLWGTRVNKRQYLGAVADDPTLPPFRPEDNAPQRVFPEEIRKHLLIRPADA
ncbi:MAG: hypothetical protein U0840_02735 [Gemmataceae bacterium]